VTTLAQRFPRLRTPTSSHSARARFRFAPEPSESTNFVSDVLDNDLINSVTGIQRQLGNA
jgi:hypothetical protein